MCACEGGKSLRGNIRSKGGFWLNGSSRILAEDRPASSDLGDGGGCGIWSDIERDQISRVGDSG